MLQWAMFVANHESSSLPSGDAAGGAAVATAGWLITQSCPYLWFLCWFGCVFGRVFFRAHHLFDVLIASCASWCICNLLFWAAKT
jgi:membrane-associated phospholipid phosphatase